MTLTVLPDNHENDLTQKTRELMRREQEVEDERRLAVKIVAEAKATAPRLANMASISEHRNRWVAYKVRTSGWERSPKIWKKTLPVRVQ